MTDSKDDVTQDTINSLTVARYLQQHPDFFIDNQQLLAALALPHPHQEGTISLIEKQIAVLRAQNAQRLNEAQRAKQHAYEQSQLFSMARKLMLRLLEAHDFGCVIDTLQAHLQQDLKVDGYHLKLTQYHAPTTHLHVSAVPLESTQQFLSKILRGGRPVVGTFNHDILKYCFDTLPLSAAIIPLGLGGRLGVLALQSQTPRYFEEQISTQYLSLIGQTLDKLIPVYLDN